MQKVHKKAPFKPQMQNLPTTQLSKQSTKLKNYQRKTHIQKSSITRLKTYNEELPQGYQPQTNQGQHFNVPKHYKYLKEHHSNFKGTSGAVFNDGQICAPLNSGAKRQQIHSYLSNDSNMAQRAQKTGNKGQAVISSSLHKSSQNRKVRNRCPLIEKLEREQSVRKIDLKRISNGGWKIKETKQKLSQWIA